ncbi:MAG: toxin [Nitrospira sp.]|nr:toxin [Nitrospira sp.]
MKHFDWNIDKNDELLKQRGISFEEVVFCIMHDGLLDIIEHPNKSKYLNQNIFIVNIDDCVCLVPFVKDDEIVFLKTIIPSRKMTKKYLGGENE